MAFRSVQSPFRPDFRHTSLSWTENSLFSHCLYQQMMAMRLLQPVSNLVNLSSCFPTQEFPDPPRRI